MAEAALRSLWRRLEKGQGVTTADVEAALRMAEGEAENDPRLPLQDTPEIRTRKAAIAPRSPAQAAYIELLSRQEMVFGVGPAGTGKTYLAVAQGVALLQAGRVDRIVLSRPAVEAGERLGFLPGDMKEKVDPYLRPLYDALHDMLPAEQVARRIASGEIEIAPLAFMRGRTLAHCFAILDEAQNTTAAQMKMFLTRMGEGTRMVDHRRSDPGRSAARAADAGWPRRCASWTGCRASAWPASTSGTWCATPWWRRSSRPMGGRRARRGRAEQRMRPSSRASAEEGSGWNREVDVLAPGNTPPPPGSGRGRRSPSDRGRGRDGRAGLAPLCRGPRPWPGAPWRRRCARAARRSVSVLLADDRD